MTSFGWKKKSGQSINRATKRAFEDNSKDIEDEVKELNDAGIDWLTLAPKRQLLTVEDALSKSSRLKREGSNLAELERYWEAVGKWDEALMLTPNDAALYEMKAQVYIALCEVFPAVSAAEKAVTLSPTWWEAYQTLGRAQLGIGEVGMAVISFSKAVHINPSNEDLWKEDLMWSISLVEKKRKIKRESRESRLSKPTEVAETSSSCGELITDVEYTRDGSEDQDHCNNEDINIKHTKVSKGYVLMRDV